MSETPTYALLSSTRYDAVLLSADWNTEISGGVPSPFLLLPYHLDRLADAAKQHGWTSSDVLSIEHLQDICNEAVEAAKVNSGDAPMKLRILLQSDGRLTANASPAIALQSSDISTPSDTPEAVRTIYVDPEPTSPSIFTSTKSTQRSMYNEARTRAGLSPLPTQLDAHIDVLLHTPDGLAMETSIRNIAFRRGDKWVTPTANSGCLPGVMRRLMLERGIFVEGDVRMQDVVPDETVLTVNSVEGCWTGKIALLPERTC